MKERNISIDILKCFAAILITNSHMGILYGNYSVLATGGAIGDSLFFFCSGFTLFLGRMGRFDNWYKRRINRIYPTIFAWAILTSFFFHNHNDMKDVLLRGGGWFISCIMIYYVFLYFIQRYFLHKLIDVFLIFVLVCVCWFFTFDRGLGFNMYGGSVLRYGFSFLPMLLGAIIGISKKDFHFCFKFDFIKLMLNVALYYGIMFLTTKMTLVWEWQIISLIPLLFITYYFYKVCNSLILKSCFEHRIWGWGIKFIGGLCLEIYLVQSPLFTDKMNAVFPLNILIMYFIVFGVAYILRCASRVFAQTFKEQEYDWKEVIKMI